MNRKRTTAFLTAAFMAAAYISAGFPAVEAAAEEQEAAAAVTEVDPASGLMTTEGFIANLEKAYNDRVSREERYTNSELNSMSDQEYVDAHLYYAEAEEDFYEKYKEARFEDMNIEYLCSTYCKGIETQLTGCRNFSQKTNFTTWFTSYLDAYNKNLSILSELAEYYDAPFSDVKDKLPEEETADTTIDDAVKRNESVDRTTVQTVQQQLNDLGFLCGTPDGQAGKKTTKSVQRFQEMYGYEPADGVIDDDLTEQLSEALGEVQAAE